MLFTFLSICLKTSKSFLFQHKSRALGSCLIPPHTCTQQADIKVVYTGWINWCRFIAHVHELQDFILPPFLSIIQHPQTGKLHELELPSVVSKQQPLEIYDPVKVEPTQLVLLWDPVSEFKYTHTLKVCAYVCMFLCRDYWLLH